MQTLREWSQRHSSESAEQLAAMIPAGKVVLHETNEWTEVRVIDLHVSNPVLDACWSPDSRHLLTANRNGTVFVLRFEPAGAEPSSRAWRSHNSQRA